MCGPSSEMKQINQSIQAFGNKVTDEAGTIFGAANSVFNDIKNAVSGIVQKGASAMGFGAGELSAKNAAAVEAGAAMARNLKGAAASAVGAIGGGNVATSSGSTQAITLGADQRAAEATAERLNQIQTEGYERGNQDFWKATQMEKEAPGVFSVVNDANKTAMEGQKAQATSQQNIDTQSNWWQPLLEKGVMAGVDAFTGGIGGGLAKKVMPSSGGSTGSGWASGSSGDAYDAMMNQQN